MIRNEEFIDEEDFDLGTIYGGDYLATPFI